MDECLVADPVVSLGASPEIIAIVRARAFCGNALPRSPQRRFAMGPARR